MHQRDLCINGLFPGLFPLLRQLRQHMSSLPVHGLVTSPFLLPPLLSHERVTLWLYSGHSVASWPWHRQSLADVRWNQTGLQWRQQRQRAPELTGVIHVLSSGTFEHGEELLHLPLHQRHFSLTPNDGRKMVAVNWSAILFTAVTMGTKPAVA